MSSTSARPSWPCRRPRHGPGRGPPGAVLALRWPRVTSTPGSSGWVRCPSGVGAPRPLPGRTSSGCPAPRGRRRRAAGAGPAAHPPAQGPTLARLRCSGRPPGRPQRPQGARQRAGADGPRRRAGLTRSRPLKTRRGHDRDAAGTECRARAVTTVPDPPAGTQRRRKGPGVTAPGRRAVVGVRPAAVDPPARTVMPRVSHPAIRGGTKVKRSPR